jgi:hypothetical protein
MFQVIQYLLAACDTDTAKEYGRILTKQTSIIHPLLMQFR